MLKITNIDAELKGRGFLWGDQIIQCKGVDGIFDEGPDREVGYYLIELDIHKGTLPLIIWLDRTKDVERNSYKIGNNLTHGQTEIKGESIKDVRLFIHKIEEYLIEVKKEMDEK